MDIILDPNPSPMGNTQSNTEQAVENGFNGRSNDTLQVSTDTALSPPFPSLPRIDEASKMIDTSPRTSRDLSAVAASWSQTASDEEKAAEEINTKIQNLLKEKEEARLRAEEGRRQAALNEQAAKQRLFVEQCADRHAHFKSGLTDHAVREMKEAAAADAIKEQALQSLVDGKGGDTEYEILNCMLAKACVGGDVDFCRDVATRILNYTSEHDERVLQEYRVQNLISASTDTVENVAGGGVSSLNKPDGASVCEVGAQHYPDSADVAAVTSSATQDGGSEDDKHYDQSVQTVAGDPLGTTIEKMSGDGAALSEKRQSLTEIEDSHTSRDVSADAESVEGVSGYLATLPGDEASAQKTATRGKEAVAAEKVSSVSNHASGGSASASSSTGKRRRNDPSTGGMATPSPKKARKASSATKTTPVFQQFTDMLDSLAAGPTSAVHVELQLRCQYCDQAPTEPKLAACAHLYCDKCVKKIRRAAKGDAKALCRTCGRELEGCKKVEDEQIEGLRARYHVNREAGR